MGLDTKSNSSLWKDKALIELNHAVLYTFQVKHSTEYLNLCDATKVLTHSKILSRNQL
jgi:nitric oxide synthase oxygenase domain/subunit